MESHEGAMLMMLSLRRNKPVDNYNATDTATYYKCYLSSSRAPCGYWRSSSHEVNFDRFNTDCQRDSLRCRSSARVFEV